MVELVNQPNKSLTPPPNAEVHIRSRWPSVASAPAVAGLGRMLNNTILLAPLGWLLMSAVFFGKLVPFLAKRYTITNRRVMISKGIKRHPGLGVELKDIDDVKVVYDANSDFFRAGTVQVISNGKVALSLPGCPEPENFKQTILSACAAFAHDRMRGPFIPASSTPAG